MSRPLKDVSPQDQQLQLDALSAVATKIQKPTVNLSNPHQYVYIVAFDGTGNDRENLEKGMQPTIVAEVEGSLNRIYVKEDDPEKGSGRVASNYYPGIGTYSSNKLYNLLDSAFAFTADDILKKAYEDYHKQASAWVEADPKAEVYLVVTGFSRGAALAREFMHEIDKAGLPHRGDYKYVESNERFPESEIEKFKIAPGEVKMAAILLDTVSTSLDSDKQPIPSSADYVLHLVSKNDPRFVFFRADSILDEKGDPDKRLQEILVPGVHSDIANAYRVEDKNGNEIKTLGVMNRTIVATALSNIGLDRIREEIPLQSEKISWQEHVIEKSLKVIVLEKLPILGDVLERLTPDERNIQYHGNNEKLSEKESSRINDIFNPEPRMSRDPSLEPGIFPSTPDAPFTPIPAPQKQSEFQEALKEHMAANQLMPEQQSASVAKTIENYIAANPKSSGEEILVVHNSGPVAATVHTPSQYAELADKIPNGAAMPLSVLKEMASSPELGQETKMLREFWKENGFDKMSPVEAWAISGAVKSMPRESMVAEPPEGSAPDQYSAKVPSSRQTDFSL